MEYGGAAAGAATVGGAAGAGAAAAGTGTLPVTGIAIGGLVGLSVLLILVGFVVLRAAAGYRFSTDDGGPIPNHDDGRNPDAS